MNRISYRPAKERPPWAIVNTKTGRIISRHGSKREAKGGDILANHLCTHGHTGGAHLVSNARQLRGDPTRTHPISMKFLANLKRRVRALNSEIFKFLVTEDELALVEGKAGVLTLRRAFEFHTDANKLTAFNEWFARQVSGGFLAPDAGTPVGAPWTTQYVESAYKRGQINAYLSSRAAGFVDDIDGAAASQVEFLTQSFNAPETISKLRLLGTRSFEQLKGFTGAMGAETNRILSQGIADGSNPRKIAKELRDSITGISKRRAETIARTEIIHAHAEGQLDAFDRLGVKDLGIMAEWSTAGDDRVCPDCFSREGQLFTVDEARNLIPLHPNCRCTWVPTPAPEKKKDKDLNRVERTQRRRDKAAKRTDAARGRATGTPRPPTTPTPPVTPQTLSQQMDDLLVSHPYSLGDPTGKIRSLDDMTKEIVADKAVHNLLKLRRPGERFAGELFTTKVKNKVLAPRVKHAEDWLKDIVPESRLKKFNPSILTKRKGTRASYQPVGNILNLPTDRPVSIIVHEYGHHLQNTDIHIMRREKAFLRKRANITKDSKQVGVEKWTPREKGFPGDFKAKGGSNYTGRIYGVQSPQRSITGEWEWDMGEVTTMGIQRLQEAPSRFFREDPEFFRFIVDSLQKGHGIA